VRNSNEHNVTGAALAEPIEDDAKTAQDSARRLMQASSSSAAIADLEKKKEAALDVASAKVTQLQLDEPIDDKNCLAEGLSPPSKPVTQCQATEACWKYFVMTLSTKQCPTSCGRSEVHLQGSVMCVQSSDYARLTSISEVEWWNSKNLTNELEDAKVAEENCDSIDLVKPMSPETLCKATPACPTPSPTYAVNWHKTGAPICPERPCGTAAKTVHNEVICVEQYSLQTAPDSHCSENPSLDKPMWDTVRCVYPVCPTAAPTALPTASTPMPTTGVPTQ